MTAWMPGWLLKISVTAHSPKVRVLVISLDKPSDWPMGMMERCMKDEMPYSMDNSKRAFRSLQHRNNRGRSTRNTWGAST